MAANTEKPLFTIRLTGEGVRPQLIPASDLAQLLVAAEQTVLAIAAREHPEQADELIVGLSQVQDQSIGFAFASNQPQIAQSAYTALVTATANRLFRSLPGRSLEGLRTLTGFSRQHNGRTQFWNGGGDLPLLDLPPAFSIEIPAPEYQRGETVIYGRIERVGGVRPRVRIRVAEREIVYGDITEEQSRELGSRLYSQAALRGQATWDGHDGSVAYFRVEEILHYDRGKVSSAFEELRRAAQGAYDAVEDVDLLASRLREGDLP
ncbi:MAG: hypothetical protein ACYC23_01870 [Limisphaerales bacterium]